MTSINKICIEHELIDSYLSYAMSVIVGRALPDVRDGLKPVHRRTLFAMKELNNKFNKSYKKSARIVGDVIGKYHPHGEIAVYDSIVRLAQTFIQRYPLIDGHGNFGSIDGDSAAAMRYTEIRMSEISDYMLKDLDFNTVDYIFNYDNTEKYPIVFPVMFPNLLINGSYGIAVGMATNIPPHNLTEVINGCLAYINNPNIDNITLNQYILGPDFPTGASIHDIKHIWDGYKLGKGQINIRSKGFLNITETYASLTINQIPYQINKVKLVFKIQALLQTNKIRGVRFIRDESDKSGLSIFINIDNVKNIKLILNKLYMLTKLQHVFHINMLCLVNNSPKLLHLNDLIKYFILHRKIVVSKRIEFIILKIASKMHTLESLCCILFNIDVFIKFITKFNNISDLKKSVYSILSNNNIFSIFKYYGFLNFNYFTKNKFSNNQFQSIINLRLSKLIKFEKNYIINIYILFLKDYFFYKSFAKITSNIDKIIKTELIFIKQKFFDIRRTKIISGENKLNIRQMVPKEILIITLSETGYIKFQNEQDYKTQHRGSQGKLLFSYLNHNDSVKTFLIESNHTTLFCFSNFGKLYLLDLRIITTSKIYSRGLHTLTFFNLDQDEIITTILCDHFNHKEKYYLILLTKNGIVKKIDINNFSRIKKAGIKAITIADNDLLIDVKGASEDSDVLLYSNFGKALRFKLNTIKSIGRPAKGIIGIRLHPDDQAVALNILTKTPSKILSCTTSGVVKFSCATQYPMKKVGGRGVIGSRGNKLLGFIISVAIIIKDGIVFTITNNGTIFKVKSTEISLASRYAKGSKLNKILRNELVSKIKIINI